MKILVTGAKGKIGTAFLEYLSERAGNTIQADSLSLRGDSWRDADFSAYDTVYYCIGIVEPSNPDIYKVNVELAYEVAKKAKASGVKKFVYLSSMAVYDFSGYRNMLPIEPDTPATATGEYGDSKRAGEDKIKTLADASFEIHIIRAPSIYGRNAERYLEYVASVAKKGYLAGFQDWKRSILYVDNLSELVCIIAESEEIADVKYYYPQNKEQYSFSQLADEVTRILHIKCKRISVPKVLEKLLRKAKSIKRKYRAYAYSKDASNHFDYKYCVVGMKESIQLTLLRG